MIHIEFDPATLTGQRLLEWQAWEKDASTATADVMEQWKGWLAGTREKPFEPKLDKKIWSRLKAWLLDHVFHGKCAYCETRAARFDYHAEHFRPKGKVTFSVQSGGKKKLQRANCLDDKGVEIQHPGYFWLSYSWENLLPSCGFCNTSKGKKTQFPVKTNHVGPYLAAEAAWPDTAELNSLETPLLLHPYRDNPREHLVFGVRGVVTPMEDSEKGKASIEVFDLAAEKLRIDRQKAQEDAQTNFFAKLAAERGSENAVSAADEFVSQIEQGIEEHSAAIGDYIRDLRRKLAG